MLILRSRDLLCILGFLLILFQTPEQIQAHSFSETDVEEIRELFYAEEFEKAIQMLQRVQEWACLVPEQRSVCLEAHIFLARIQLIQQAHLNTEQSVSFAMGLVSQYSISDPNPITRLYSIRAQLALERGYRPEAGEWLEMASDLVEQETLTNDVLLSYLITNGNLKHEEGDYQSAILFYNQAIRIAENSTPPVMKNSYLMKAYHNRGTSYMKSGEITRAGTDFRRSLELARSNLKPESISLGYIHNSLGTIYHKQGDYNQAGSYFFMAASHFSKQDSFESLSAGALNNAAASYLKIGNLTRAATLFESILEIQAEFLEENHPELAVTFQNKAAVEWLSGSVLDAIENYEAAIRIRKNHFGTLHPLLIESYRQAAEFYADIGEYEKARYYFDEAIQITQHNFGDVHPHYQRIHTSAGRRYMEEDHLIEAHYHLYKAWDQLMAMVGYPISEGGSQIDFLTISYPLDMVNTVSALGDLYLKKYEPAGSSHHLHKAVDKYSLAMKAVDQLFFSYNSDAARLKLQERYQGLYSNAVKAAFLLYQATGDSSWAELMLQFNEKGRARVALDLLTESLFRQVDRGPERLLRDQNELRNRIMQLNRRIEEFGFQGSVLEVEELTRLKEDLIDAKRAWNTLSERVRTEKPEYHFYRFGSGSVDRRVLSELLSEQELLLSYMSDDQFLYVVTMDNREVRAFKLGKMAEIQRGVVALREAIDKDSLQEFIPVSKALFENLLQPVLSDMVDKNSLIILADSELHFLPFEVLLTDYSNSSHFYNQPFLIREYAVRYSPSASVLALTLTYQQHRNENILLVSPFEESMGGDEFLYKNDPYLSELLPLSLTGYETESIASLFHERKSIRERFFPQTVTRIRNRDATIENFLSEELSQFGYIHLATHAFVNPQNPLHSGILFQAGTNDDGILSLTDIYRLQLNASLLVLSACETGLGKVYSGEGMVGFYRAFLYAGASGVLVSGWKVNDQAAARLMTAFYTAVRNGSTYTNSLQVAKLNLISHPLYSSPRNWAAFQLHGR